MTDTDAMQDSGVEWIGAIPQGWKWYRIKDVAELSPTYSADKPDSEMLCTVIPMECVSEKGIVDTSNVYKYGNISKGLTFFEKGDVIFAKITPCMENGKGAYIEYLPTKYAFGSTEFHVSRTGYKLDGKFLYYYTFNDGFRDYAAVNMTGAAGQKRVSTNFLKYTLIYLPDISEQQAITRYLDQRCGKLDAIIAIKQQQIKTLDALRQSIIYHAVTKGLDDSVPLVDSGVEWLGKIPQRWKVKIIKREFDVKLGKMLQPLQKTELDTEEYYLKTSNVYWNGVNINDIKKMWFSPLDKTNTELQYNDLLVCEGGDVGRSALWEEEITPCYIQNAINRVRPIHNCSTKYLYYWLFFLKHADYIDAMVSRITIAHLTAEKLERIIFLLPPLPEQHRIADHLDHETQRLNDLKENLSQQTSTLETYKKALIYECVTGKKRIKADERKTG